MNLQDHIRAVADFPKPGINFYDISPLLAHNSAWIYAIDRLKELIIPHKPDFLAGVESRGFLLAAPLAYALNIGFVMVRKPGKLPGKTVSFTYDLEYGTDTLEVQKDAGLEGKKVVVVDDVLATGGTLAATLKLLNQVGAEVPCACGIMELTFLDGQKRLDAPFEALVKYDQ